MSFKDPMVSSFSGKDKKGQATAAARFLSMPASANPNGIKDNAPPTSAMVV